MTSKKEKEAAEAEVAEAKALDEQQAAEDEPGEQERGPSGPTFSPAYQPERAAPVEPTPVVEPREGEGETDYHAVDDGVEDVELGPPVVGSWVQIKSGDYAGHFAAYLEDVEVDEDGNPVTVQVRTRDADNVTFDLPYSDVTATTYSGGR
jgi:hypothetical protein